MNIVFNRMQLCTIHKLCIERYVLFESRESMIDRCKRNRLRNGEELVNGLRIFVRIRIFESAIKKKHKKIKGKNRLSKQKRN